MRETLKRKVQEASSLRERIGALEDLVDKVEEELNEVLGIEEDQELEEEGFSSDQYLSMLTDLLASMQEREASVLPPPSERLKSMESREILEMVNPGLNELLTLYRRYLGEEKRVQEICLDDNFENLIDSYSEKLKKLFSQNPDRWFPMEELFLGGKGRKEAIATFLVILDLVFRKEIVTRDQEGKVLFRRL